MWCQSLCSRRLWLRRLRLGSPMNPVPLPVSTTGRLSLSNTGITRRPLLTHTTGHRLSHTTARLLSHTTGRLQVIMTNTTRPQVAPDTSYLTALPYTGRLPARVERPIWRMSRGNDPQRSCSARRREGSQRTSPSCRSYCAKLDGGIVRRPDDRCGFCQEYRTWKNTN
jgi:hypothetical protein